MQNNISPRAQSQSSQKSKYVFTTSQSQNNYDYSMSQTPNNKKNFTFFYQITTCKDLQTNTYQMRKFVLDSDNNFSKITKYNLTPKQYKKFFTLYKPHEYKMYSVIDLNLIKYPSFFDINTANSAILTKNYDYSGNYAPF